MSRGKCIILNYFVWYNAAMNGEWTTELPTRDGFYWIRNYTINYYPNRPQWNDTEPVPTIVEISANSFSFIGCDSSYYANELLFAEWFGPIQPPEDKPQDKINTRATALGVFLGADKLDSPKEQGNDS